MPKLKAFRTKTKPSTVKVKLMWSLILDFHCMSVRGMNKAKRQLRFVLMTLNIIKVTTQRAENNQKYKRQFLYYFNRNCLYLLILELYVPGSFPTISQVLIIKISIT